MADLLHTSIAAFRDTMLTALAKLEFQLRDVHVSKQSTYGSMGTNDEYEDASRLELAKLTNMMGQLSMRIASLEVQSTSAPVKSDPLVSELLNIHPVSNTRNILVSSVRSTPALAAAVAASSIPNLDLGFNAGDAADEESSIEHEEEDDDKIEEDEVEADEEEVEEEEVEDVEAEVVEESAASESESSEPELKPIKIEGKPYYIDDDQNVYAETEDGYEQVGTYNSKTKKLVVEEAEESEGEIEVEDFVYKGKTYQRDENNIVYLDGEQIGTWNGKRIVA